MDEIRYFEAIVYVSGTTRLGVYARSKEEAFELLEEYVDDFGIDKYSRDLELDDFEITSAIEERDERNAYEVANSKENFQEEDD